MGSNWSGRLSAALTKRRFALGLGALLAALALDARGTQDAIANGDTRTITLHHTHTKETATVTFRKWGRYDSDALTQLNWLLRDWRRDEPTKMDPRLFDTLWEVTREVGTSGAIHVVSAYRSPETNAALRRRSNGVSEFSQHMRGKAMDFFLPDASMARVREVGMRLQKGGVGFYPTSYNPFVHLDVGSVRSWPRMSRDQLARIFPNGKTVHLPTDGRPLERYEEAKAEIIARGGSVAGYAGTAVAEDAVPGGGKSLWARLFGSDEDDDAALANAAAKPVAAARPSRGGTGAVALATAYAPRSGSGHGDARSFFAAADPKPQEEVRGADVRRSGRRGAPTAEPGRTEVASANFEREAAEPAGARAPAIVPLPPKRPGDLAVLLAAAPPQAPPRPRPIEVATAGDMPVLGSLAPLPPMRPGEPVGARPAATLRVGEDERGQLKALFAAATSASAPTRAAPVATAHTRAQPLDVASLLTADTAVLQVGFSTAPADDLPQNRFTGPAVKPLPILR